MRTLPRAIPESISRDAILSRLCLIGMAMPATFVVSVLFGATLNAGFSWYIVYASIGTAIVIGLPIFSFELFYVYSPLGAGFRRWPFARFIAVRFALWCAWIFIATRLSSHWFSRTEGELFADADFRWIILFSFVVGFSAVSGLTLNRLIGPGVFSNFLLGRYHIPREEERALLFIDLVGSTAIAERNGVTRFLELMNEFVHDIGAALEGSGGVLYQYVSGEAIITWRLGEPRNISGAVGSVFRLHARVASRGDVYRSRFGMVPAFRAALHAGPVVVGEIGDSKLEIVLLGDTVNTNRADRAIVSRVRAGFPRLCRSAGPDDFATRARERRDTADSDEGQVTAGQTVRHFARASWAASIVSNLNKGLVMNKLFEAGTS